MANKLTVLGVWRLRRMWRANFRGMPSSTKGRTSVFSSALRHCRPLWMKVCSVGLPLTSVTYAEDCLSGELEVLLLRGIISFAAIFLAWVLQTAQGVDILEWLLLVVGSSAQWDSFPGGSNKCHLLNKGQTSLGSFLCFGNLIQDTTLDFVILSPWVFLGCDSFSHFLCFWWPWQLGGVLIRHFVECPFTGTSLMFSHDKTGTMGCWKEDQGGQMPFWSHHVEGTNYTRDLSLLMLTLTNWME